MATTSPTHTITLTEAEAHRVLAALVAVCRTGGGSATWSLVLKLVKETGLQVDHALVLDLSSICIQEAREAGVLS